LRTEPFAELLQAHEATLRGPEYLTLWSMLTAGMHTELLPPDAQELLQTITDPRQDLLLGYWDDLLTMTPAELGDRMAADLRVLGETGAPYRIVFGHTPSANHQNWLTEILPEATSTVLPDSGHFPHLAAPAPFARILAAHGRPPLA
jgi:pimeloyl-ACP methyl ester carboxylesterase